MKRLLLMYALGAVCIFNALFPAVIRAQNDGHPTGLKPLTTEQKLLVKKEWNKIDQVTPNDIALDRMNASASQLKSGTPNLTLNELSENWSDLKAATALPASVDNSKLPGFPPIGNQGSQGSCAPFSIAYYQMTHEYSMVNGWNNTQLNYATIFSPRWIYNFLNDGTNTNCTDIVYIYSLIQKQGVCTWYDFPYDGFSGDSLSYRAWSMDPAVWRNAINYRINTPSYIDLNEGAGIPFVKQVLTNGHVLIFGTYIGSWTFQNVKDDPATSADNPFVGQQICVSQNGYNGSHCMCIVGYDDNIWVDINGNNKVDPREKGALKIANSWGNSWGNNGFIWVAYDALKTVSTFTALNSADRTPVVDSYAYMMSVRKNYQPKVLGECTCFIDNRRNLNLGLGISSTSLTMPEVQYNLPGIFHSGGSYAFDGTNTACNATFVFDFTDLASNYVSDPDSLYRYYFNFATGGYSPLTVQSFSLKDGISGNVLTSASNVPKVIGGGDFQSPYLSARYSNIATNAHQADIYKTGQAPVIDGTIDKRWNEAISYPLSKLISGINTPGNPLGCKWKLLANDKNLYIMADIKDNTLISDSPDWWDDDGIEVFIDATNSKGTSYDGLHQFQFGFRYNDTKIYAGVNSVQNTTGIKFVIKAKTGGYIFEASIPWTLLGISPADELKIGIDLKVNNDDNGGPRDSELSWNASTSMAYADPSLFGNGKIINKTAMAYTLAGKIAIDGNPDPIWYNVDQNNINNHTIGTLNTTYYTYPDLKGSWQAYSTKDSLYLLVKTLDRNVVNNNRPNWWDDDAVEVFIDATNKKDTVYDGKTIFQYGFRYNDRTLHTGPNSVNKTTGIHFATTRNANLNGWNLEVAIPWTTLGITQSLTTVIGFEVQVDDNDTSTVRQKQIEWASVTNNAYKNPSSFGTLTFTDVASIVNYTGNYLTIDGARWDESWDNSYENLIGINSKTYEIPKTPSWNAVYNDKYLYIMIYTPDTVRVNHGGSDWWDDDAIELFIDANNSKGTTYDGKNDFQFGFRYNDPQIYTGINSVHNTSGIVKQMLYRYNYPSVNDYQLEAAIPWTLLGVTPQAGLKIGLEVEIDDNDFGLVRNNQYRWFTTGEDAYTNPSGWGTIQLGEKGMASVQKDSVKKSKLAQNDPKATITLYPNPATDYVNVVLSGKYEDLTIIEVYNLLGQKIFSQECLNGSATINTSILNKGIYLIRVGGANSQNNKLIIRR